MPQISIVNLSEIKRKSNNKRIDSEYFRKEYLDIESKLLKISKKTLADYEVVIKHPAEIKRVYNEKGVLFLRTQNIRPLRIDLTEKVFISEEDGEKLHRNRVIEGDILITRTGANFGQTTILLDNQLKAVASSHVLILRTKKINPYYLAIFLNTSFGRKMINKGMYGGLQPEIAPYYLLQIPIPVFEDKFTENVENLLKESYKLLISSEKKYSEASDLLLNQVGLTKVKPREEISYTVKITRVQLNNRFDAEYYQPKYDEMIEIASKNSNLKKLGDLVKITKGVEVGSEEYQEEGVPFVRVSNLTKFGINDNSQKFISDQLYQSLKARYKPKKGEILLSKDATPGIAYMIENELDILISGGILRLKVDDSIDKNYLTLVLNSPFIQSQIIRDSGGSIIVHWRPETIKETLIPITSKEKQTQISKLVEEAHRARLKSKQLLSEAINKVEERIK